MERNVRYVWIGAIFFITLICMVGFVLWLNRIDLDSTRYKPYYAYSLEEISGIGANTPIRYKGISVGRVSKVAFKDIKEGVIEVAMLIDSAMIIKTNASVMLSTQGLAGASYLALIQGDGEELVPNSDGKRVLGLQKGSLDKILGKASELGDEASSLLKNLNKTFGSESDVNALIKELHLSLKHLQSISATLDSNIKKGEYNMREMLSPTLLQLQGSLQDMSRFFNAASALLNKIEKNPYDSLFGKEDSKESKK